MLCQLGIAFSLFLARLFYRRSKWDVDIQAALVEDASVLRDLIQFACPALLREDRVVSMCRDGLGQ